MRKISKLDKVEAYLKRSGRITNLDDRRHKIVIRNANKELAESHKNYLAKIAGSGRSSKTRRNIASC